MTPGCTMARRLRSSHRSRVGDRNPGAVESMSESIRIRVQEADFDPGAEIEGMRAPGTGAVVSFVGIARDFSGEFPVERITLEHYPGMTQASLAEIARQAMARWTLREIRIIHRFGELAPGDRIVLVATSSTHRDAAFDACRFLIDFLKTGAPFWKREAGPLGSRWVDARDSDEQALGRWSAGEG